MDWCRSSRRRWNDGRRSCRIAWTKGREGTAWLVSVGSRVTRSSELLVPRRPESETPRFWCEPTYLDMKIAIPSARPGKRSTLSLGTGGTGRKFGDLTRFTRWVALLPCVLIYSNLMFLGRRISYRIRHATAISSTFRSTGLPGLDLMRLVHFSSQAYPYIDPLSYNSIPPAIACISCRGLVFWKAGRIISGTSLLGRCSASIKLRLVYWCVGISDNFRSNFCCSSFSAGHRRRVWVDPWYCVWCFGPDLGTPTRWCA